MNLTSRTKLCLALIGAMLFNCSSDSNEEIPNNSDFLTTPGNILTCAPNGSSSRCSVKPAKKLELVSTPLENPSLIRLNYTFNCPGFEGISPIVIETDAQQRRFIYNQENKSISLFGWKGSSINIKLAEGETFFTAPQGGCLLKITKLTTQEAVTATDEG